MNKAVNVIKSWGFWLQVVIWIFLFLLPLSFVSPNEPTTLRLYLLRASLPTAQMIIFYLNFLLLVPLFIKGKHRLFWIINIILVIVLAFFVHECMIIVWNIRSTSVYIQRIWIHTWSFQPLLLLREVFNLSLAIGIAVAIIMSRRWIVTEKARQEAEAARSAAELSNLRSQINPHFLLNTLNNIYALTCFYPKQAQEAIMDLSKMLRHILYKTQERRIDIKEEILFIESYINLMKRRITKNVEIQKEIEIPTTISIYVVPMIFITLIENAFKHGISPTEKSLIRIHIHATHEQIVCHLENTNFPKTAGDQSGHGIGLQQTAKRLELAYHGKYEWQRGIIPNTNIYSSKITIYDTELCNY